MRDSALSAVLREVERYGKIRALALSLDLVKSVRKIVIVLLSALLGFLVCVGSFFSLLVYESASVARGDGITVDVFSTLTLALSLIALGVFIWGIREKTWLKILHVPSGIERALRVPDRPPLRAVERTDVAPVAPPVRTSDSFDPAA